MEKPILDTIREFVSVLQDLETRKTGTGCAIDLKVTLPGRYDSEGPPKIELSAYFYDGSNGQNVKAASLDALMEEVRRRLGFEDREAVRLQTLAESFKALEAPQESPEEDPSRYDWAERS